MDKKLLQLEKALLKIKKPTLSSEAKKRMRQDMLMRMETPIAAEVKYPSLERVRTYVKKVSEVTQPSYLFKAKIKENVLAIIGKRKYSFNFQWQKILATLMIGVISLTSFTVYFADISVTKAASKTAFQELYGDVDVIRNGETIEAFKYMQLQEGDIIVTGESGLAVIRYVDDSVSRLSPLTELRMRRLYQDENVQSKTEVEVELTKGRVWNQVVNLVDDQSSFEVNVKNVKARTSEKASFDITHDDKVEVAVFSNKVEVSVPEKKQENKKIIVEGYSVEVENQESTEDKISLDTKEDELWVEVNKAEDKQYKKEVDKEKEEEAKADAGVLPSDPLYSAKKLNESTKLLVAKDATEKSKLKVDIAVKRLDEASTLLVEGDEEGAHASLEEFEEMVEEISEEVDTSDEFKEYLEDSFADEEKDLSIVMPDGNRYEAKEALRDAQLTLAVTNEEKNEVSLKSATEKVVEAKELFEDDKGEHAQDTLLEAAKEIVTASAEEDASGSAEETEQKEDALSTVRTLKDAVEDDETVTNEVKLIIEATEEVLEKPSEPALESDSAVVIEIEQRTIIQLRAVQE